MARPSSVPRLRDLTPQAVADEVVRLVTDHVASLCMRLDLGAEFRVPEGGTLHFTTQLLTGYAQRGLGATDWPDHSCATDAMLDVCCALYTSAGDPDIGAGALDTDVDASDAIGIVLLAAHARVRIAQRERVPVRELAALASVDPQHLRLLGRSGEIDIEDGTVRAAIARRWLSGRGLEGLDGTKN
jgi:hypothetical protein